MAALAIEAEPQMVNRLVAEAEAALTAARLEDADHLSTLAAAVAGNPDALPPRLRMRERLKPIA